MEEEDSQGRRNQEDGVVHGEENGGRGGGRGGANGGVSGAAVKRVSRSRQRGGVQVSIGEDRDTKGRRLSPCGPREAADVHARPPTPQGQQATPAPSASAARVQRAVAWRRGLGLAAAGL